MIGNTNYADVNTQNHQTIYVPEGKAISFNGWDNVVSIVAPYATTLSDVRNCTKLRHIYCPSVTSLGGNVNAGCLRGSAIKKLDLPSIVSIGMYACSNAESLEELNLPLATSIGGGAFTGCTSLTSIDTPLVTSIDGNAFTDCPLEGNLTFERQISIGNFAFQGNQLESIVFEKSVEMGINAIGGRFTQSPVKSIYFRHIENTIGNNALQNCKQLQNVFIPDGWNTTNLNVNASTLFTHDIILDWFNKFADRTGDTTYTFTIGTTNLNKMSASEIAIATAKNWTIA